VELLWLDFIMSMFPKFEIPKITKQFWEYEREAPAHRLAYLVVPTIKKLKSSHV
jgi:hypothetical protein